MEESNSSNDSPRPTSGESRNPSGATLREKLQLMRARSRANAKPLRSSISATPSSAGDIEPTLPSSAPQGPSPLSVRAHPVSPEHHIEAPTAFVAPQELHISDVQESTEPNEQTLLGLDESINRGGVSLGPSEFAIPLPMDARVKDDYETTINNESKHIRKFMTEPESGERMEVDDNSTIPSLKQMMRRLNNIAIHADLNIADQITSQADNSKEASWAEYSSSKFQFLRYFIDAAADEILFVVILVRAGKTVQIVENYLLGNGFTHFLGSNTPDLCSDRLSFSIRATNDEEMRKSANKPSLIIALDNSFDANNASVQDLRTMWGGNIVPVIRPIIANSIEHVELCIPNSLNRFRRLVRHTIAFRGTVGELQDDALGVQETAEEIVSYLSTDDFQERWALPLLEALDVDDFENTPSDAEAEPSTPEPEQLRSTAPSRQKRWRDGEEHDDNPSKKQRTTPLEDLAEVGDTIRSQNRILEDSLKVAEEKLLQMQKDHAAELNTLQFTLAQVQSSYRETESALSTLQHRYESRTEELHKTRHERDQALETNAKSEQRFQRQRVEIDKLKEERTTLTTDLKDARETVKSGGGSASELEIAREEIRTLRSSNASLEKTVQYEKSQSEYTRQQYQNASTAAAQSGMETRQLQEENEELKRKIASEASKLKELKLKSDEKKHLNHIEELKLALTSREKLLKKREEDLRDLMKNRPFRRASSTTPRSFSRPNSPGALNGGNRSSALRSISEAAQ